MAESPPPVPLPEPEPSAPCAGAAGVAAVRLLRERAGRTGPSAVNSVNARSCPSPGLSRAPPPTGTPTSTARGTPAGTAVVCVRRAGSRRGAGGAWHHGRPGRRRAGGRGCGRRLVRATQQLRALQHDDCEEHDAEDDEDDLLLALPSARRCRSSWPSGSRSCRDRPGRGRRCLGAVGAGDRCRRGEAEGVDPHGRPHDREGLPARPAAPA